MGEEEGSANAQGAQLAEGEGAAEEKPEDEGPPIYPLVVVSHH